MNGGWPSSGGGQGRREPRPPVIRYAACADSGLDPDDWFPASWDPAVARVEAAVALAVCWAGTWKEGQGTLSTQGPTVRDAAYTYASRFEGAEGAVPEELLAAAYAGCLNQAFANVLGWGNFTAESIETMVEIEVELGSRDKVPGRIHITMRARVPGINRSQFAGLTITAKNGCLISRLLKADASMEATLLD